ncbi:MAG: lipid-A-disaccharide synthase [Chlorobi bacterium]|nr:lipid-A-disaccharide synthase [Chlorobiota bacterium]
MKYFLIAGEASGDMHAARLMEALRRRDPEAEFMFTGGDRMAQAAEKKPLIHYRDMAYMGVWDVIKHLGEIRRNFKRVRQAIAEFRPHAIIPVDYPGFNLRLIREAKPQGYKIFYYIPPKVWAWKEGRVKTLKHYTDRILSILPFEPEFYARYGMQVPYVGNPVKEHLREFRPTPRDQWLKEHGLDERPLVALLPGSRVSEIKYMLPVMTEVAARFPEWNFAVAAAPGLDPEIYRSYLPSRIPLIYNATYDLLAASRAALVTSGTATLETALLGIPQITGYRTLPLQYALGKHLIKTPWISLVNLIAGREVIPELIQNRFHPDLIAPLLKKLMADGPERARMLEGYAFMDKRLGELRASETAADYIVKGLQSL